jgi:hypothetical protein
MIMKIFKPGMLPTISMLLLFLFPGVQLSLLAQAPPPGPPAGTKAFTVTVFLEGLYNTATDQMNKAQDAGPVNRFPATIADRITIELHEPGNYGTPVATTTANLLQDGTAVAYLPESGSYYLTIKHRNHLETVSAATIDFATATSYNFTTAASQAYGDNMLELESGVFGLYAGDLDADGSVTLADNVLTNSGVQNVHTGYLPADVDGDGFLTLTDMVIINANVQGVIQRIVPL